MSWLDAPIGSFDLETTGIDPRTARVVSACLWVDDALPQEWLVDPGCEIPEAACAVHGLTTAHVRAHGRLSAECLDELREALHRHWSRDLPLVVFNAPYDLTLLAAELARHGLAPLVVGPVLDPLVIWRQQERYRPGPKRLGDAAVRFGVTPGRAHCSTGDATTALAVLRAMALEWELDEIALAQLTADQAGWHAQWAASFAEWLSAQSGQARTIDAGWPLAS